MLDLEDSSARAGGHEIPRVQADADSPADGEPPGDLGQPGAGPRSFRA